MMALCSSSVVREMLGSTPAIHEFMSREPATMHSEKGIKMELAT